MPTRGGPAPRRYRITLLNCQRKRRIDTAGLAALLSRLPALTPSPSREVGVALVGDRTIARLHRRHLGNPAVTDILSFRLSAAYSELVISAETAGRNARRYGQTIEEEIACLVIHGLLHLQGHDDGEPGPARRMLRLQEAVAAVLLGPRTDRS